jgi:hypothetical protein
LVSAVVIVVLVAAGLGAVLLGVGRGGNRGSKDTSGGLPAALAGEHLFFAEPARTGVYRADGSMLSDLQAVSGEGETPLVSGDGMVVYIHSGQAYRINATGPLGAPPVVVGPATSIFPALGGAVGIESGPQGGPQRVQYMAAGGTFPMPGAGPTDLPPGVMAVAQLADGLLVETYSDVNNQFGPNPVLALSRLEGRSTLPLGTASGVIDTHSTTAAWVTCPTNPPADCSLRLVDTATGRNRPVAAPAGYSGYGGGGAFSADGKSLAVFVSTYDRYGGTVLHLAVINTATASAVVIGPALPVGTPAGTAAWSRDGKWLFFGAAGDGTLYAERTDFGELYILPLPTSVAVTGL